jgi:group I intron endonuclease
LLCEVPNEDLNDREKEEIFKNNTLSPHGYNLHKGGDCNEVHPETIKKQKSLWGPKHPLWNQRHTQETKLKISEATRGEKNPMYGKKHAPEIIKNLSLNNHMNGKTGGLAPISKRVDEYSLDGAFLQTFECIKEAAESIGRSKTGISNCIHGRAKTSGGFIWKFNKDKHNITGNGEPI